MKTLLLGILTVATWHSRSSMVRSARTWEKRFDLNIDHKEATTAFFEDGSYVIGATHVDNTTQHSSLLVRKFNATDHTEWIYSLNHSEQDHIQAVAIGEDHQIGILATTYHHNIPHLFLAALSKEGDLLWSYGLNSSHPYQGNAMVAIPGGGYMITGYTLNITTGKNVFVAHFNTSGHPQWMTFFGGDKDEEGISLTFRNNSTIITGYTLSYGATGADLFITELDLSGSIAWHYVLHQSHHQYGQAIMHTLDGSFIVTGYVDDLHTFNMFIAEFDETATLQRWQVLNESGDTKGHAIASTHASHAMILGTTHFNASNNSEIFMLPWHQAAISSMKIWDQDDYTQAYDIIAHNEKLITIGTQHNNNTGYANILLLKSFESPLDNCSMTVMPTFKNLTTNSTQVSISPTLFFPPMLLTTSI